MNPVLADAAEMLGRLCIAAPVIFAGLLLVMDPPRFLKLVNTVSDSLQRFRDYLQSSPWEDPFLGSREVPDSPRTRTVVRCAGLALTMLGLVHLAGMVS